MQLTQWVLGILGGMFFLGFGAFGILSLVEKERRAAIISFFLAAGSSSVLLVLVAAPSVLRVLAFGTIAAAFTAGVILFILPFGGVKRGNDIPKKRFDERDVQFARFFRIQPGTPEYEAYYQMRPEKKTVDDLTRSKPGLNAPGSLFYHPVLAAAVDASFFLTEALSGSVDGPVSPNPMKFDPSDATTIIKDVSKYYGALAVGVTKLKPYHVYSHIGRGPGVYGQPIDVEHRYAIAFTVEMDHEMIGPNPNLQGSMESARQYVEAARVAVQLAAFIRKLGYSARAHTDGNYQVICPIVARDAGLGEIGRMGLLMTPTHGPRVRIAVVTTDLPLLPDKRDSNNSVLDFCEICKKCAVNCPSQSIQFDDRQMIDGALRWRIDSDTCFHYWMTSGTDCGRCISVCPYSHPDNIAHNLVRWAVRHSGFARRLVLLMDDVFYGRKPERRPPPDWTKINLDGHQNH